MSQNKRLEKEISLTEFFIKSHPDADIEAVLRGLVKETLKAAGEWLEENAKIHTDKWGANFHGFDGHRIGEYTGTKSDWEQLIESLKQGNLPSKQ